MTSMRNHLNETLQTLEVAPIAQTMHEVLNVMEQEPGVFCFSVEDLDSLTDVQKQDLLYSISRHKDYAGDMWTLVVEETFQFLQAQLPTETQVQILESINFPNLVVYHSKSGKYMCETRDDGAEMVGTEDVFHLVHGGYLFRMYPSRSEWSISKKGRDYLTQVQANRAAYTFERQSETN